MQGAYGWKSGTLVRLPASVREGAVDDAIELGIWHQGSHIDDRLQSEKRCKEFFRGSGGIIEKDESNGDRFEVGWGVGEAENEAAFALRGGDEPVRNPN